VRIQNIEVRIQDIHVETEHTGLDKGYTGQDTECNIGIQVRKQDKHEHYNHEVQIQDIWEVMHRHIGAVHSGNGIRYYLENQM
jgi:hypothetical protein